MLVGGVRTSPERPDGQSAPAPNKKSLLVPYRIDIVSTKYGFTCLFH